MYIITYSTACTGGEQRGHGPLGNHTGNLLPNEFRCGTASAASAASAASSASAASVTSATSAASAVSAATAANTTDNSNIVTSDEIFRINYYNAKQIYKGVNTFTLEIIQMGFYIKNHI